MKTPWEQTKRDMAIGGLLFIVTAAVGLYLTGSFRLAYAFGGCVGIFALGIGLVGIRELRKGLASKRWPSVPGRVSVSAVRPSMGTRYVSDIQVIYEVDGQTHICSRVAFGPFSSKEECNKQLVAKYPVGQELPVYFDPETPGNSVCKPGTSASLLWYVVVVAMGVYGGVMMVLQARSGR